MTGYDGSAKAWSYYRIDCYASSWDVEPTYVAEGCRMQSPDFLSGKSREGILRFSIHLPRTIRGVRVSLDGDYVVSDYLPLPP